MIFATDAQGAGEGDNGGYGIVAAGLPTHLTEAVFECGVAPGFTVTTLSGDIRPLRNPERAFKRTVPYTRLPAALFDDNLTKWHEIDWGRWREADHITLGEMRGVVKLSGLLARCPSMHRSKVISLQDNRPAQGASMKGRSVAPALNYLLRKKAANCVAACINMILPWTASALMPADALSRQAEPGAGLD